jgi:cytochrome c oxidase assembly protein subunit 15
MEEGPLPRHYVRFSAGLVLATLALLVVGAAVRVNGAGLACPDWPLCFGQVLPPMDMQVGFEFGHRLFAAVISVGFLYVAYLVYRTPVLWNGWIRKWTGMAALLLLAQVILGALTVWQLLAQWTVTTHLLVGNAFCVCVLVIALGMRDVGRDIQRPAVNSSIRIWGGLFLLGVLIQIGLGGLVSSNYAGLACETWPSCNGGEWFPTLSGTVGLQVMHRIGAYTVAILSLFALRLDRAHPLLWNLGRALMVLVCMQVCLGISNVWLHLPVELAILHSAFADGLLLLAAWINYEVWCSPLNALDTFSKPVSVGVS